MIEHAHLFVDRLAKVLELVGAAIILGGVVLATARFLIDGSVTSWHDAYGRYRAGLGRGILLGLELLVGVIAIRTFLSFSLETEIEGCWPWQRMARERQDDSRGSR